jgi:hypothetical protein
MNQEPIDFDDLETRLAMEQFLAFMDLILPEPTTRGAADSADQK